MASEANFSCFDDNLSRNFLTEEVWSLNPVVQSDTPTRYTLAAIVILLLLLGLPSNILVITVVLKRKLYQQQPTIVLLLNLAVTDLLVCVLVMPWNIVTLIAGEFQFGEDDYTRCKVCQTGVIFIILSLVTLNNLAVVAVDRLLYLRSAIHYNKLVTNTRVLLATIGVWSISIAITIPPLFGFNEMRFSSAAGICTIAFSGSTHLTKNSYYLILLAVVVLIPIATLVVTNAWGMCIIQNHLRKKSNDLKKDKLNHRRSFRKKLKKKQQTGQVKLVKIYCAIFITNLITYIPIVARLITGVVAEDDEFTQAVRISGSLAYIALLSQSVVHPIVQASLIANVRNGIAAQLSTITNKVRKISRSEFNIEDSYNARKTSRNEFCQSNIEDSYNARKTSRNEFSQSKLEDSYNARKTSRHEISDDTSAEKGAIANGHVLEAEHFGCTNLTSLEMGNREEGNEEAPGSSMDSYNVRKTSRNEIFDDTFVEKGAIANGHALEVERLAYTNLTSLEMGNWEGNKGASGSSASVKNIDLPENSDHSDRGHKEEGDGHGPNTAAICSLHIECNSAGCKRN